VRKRGLSQKETGNAYAKVYGKGLRRTARMTTSPTGHFAYKTLRLRDISDTGQFAYYLVKTNFKARFLQL